MHQDLQNSSGSGNRIKSKHSSLPLEANEIMEGRKYLSPFSYKTLVSDNHLLNKEEESIIMLVFVAASTSICLFPFNHRPPSCLRVLKLLLLYDGRGMICSPDDSPH